VKKRPIKWQAGLGALLACGSTMVVAADIYRSTHSDGSIRYASQALDPSYALYLKGGPDSVGPKPSLIRLSSSRSAHQAALDPLIEQIAYKHAVDPALVRAVIAVESRFNPHAVSAKGATGAMQLMPATAARYGVTNRADPTQNIEAGVRYLKDLLALHRGNVALALASYNAGEGAVARHGRRIPPYKETMLYVPAVLTRLEAARNTPTP
jgi:soluble lytic murein transglycosylase-like protein